MATWVLLHGTPLTPAVWRDVAAQLVDQPVVVPDCTQVPNTPHPQMDLALDVLAGLDSAELDVVGHSFGGQVAIDLALADRSRIRSLTILCSRDTPFPAFAAASEQLRTGGPAPTEVTLSRWFTAEELETGSDAVRQARADLAAASHDDWATALDAIACYDRTGRRAALEVPVALIAAGHDAVSSPEVMAELAAGLPRASYECRPEWAHMSPFVDPAGLAALLTGRRDAAIAPA